MSITLHKFAHHLYGMHGKIIIMLPWQPQTSIKLQGTQGKRNCSVVRILMVYRFRYIWYRG